MNGKKLLHQKHKNISDNEMPSIIDLEDKSHLESRMCPKCNNIMILKQRGIPSEDIFQCGVCKFWESSINRKKSM